MAERTCLVCGAAFVPRAVTTKYCSKACGNRAFHLRRVADGRKAEQRRKHAAKDRRKAVERGTLWRSANSQRVRDTDRLRRRRNGVRSARWRSAEAKLRRSLRSNGGKTVLVQGQCARCGDQFTSRCPAGTSAKFCSDRCRGKGSRSDTRRARRARERAAFVAPVVSVEIFTRDRWICGICAEPVDPALEYPNLRSASLDHVIPLAAGGTHEPDNCQCAHFICNSLKSDAPPSLTSDMEVSA
jgi:hypothetical protein